MKKLLFWLLIAAEVAVLLRIAGILMFDLQRLTKFGFGYLSGLVILFSVLGGFLFLLWKAIYRKKKVVQ